MKSWQDRRPAGPAVAKLRHVLPDEIETQAPLASFNGPRELLKTFSQFKVTLPCKLMRNVRSGGSLFRRSPGEIYDVGFHEALALPFTGHVALKRLKFLLLRCVNLVLCTFSQTPESLTFPHSRLTPPCRIRTPD